MVIDLAKREGIPVKEEIFTPFSLYTSDECFLTGTAAEVIPVTKINGRIIGGGEVGKITRLLMKRFRQLTKTEGISIY